MPTRLLCPSCGADVPVRSAALPYVTCAYCHSLIRRTGPELTAIGQAAVLPFDVSPIQLGTSGTWNGKQFAVAGRVRWGWRDGSWNEWYLACADGVPRWLAEAMGAFMITAEQPGALETPLGAAFAAGAPIARDAELAVAGERFAASDIKQAECLGSEGDLPGPTPAGLVMTSIDFRSSTGAGLSLQRDPQGATAWLGQAIELGQLAPGNLRVLDGWTIPARLR